MNENPVSHDARVYWCRTCGEWIPFAQRHTHPDGSGDPGRDPMVNIRDPDDTGEFDDFEDEW